MSEAVAPARLLNDEGRADCPFERYPGYVLFPDVMGLSEYRYWIRFNEAERQELLSEEPDTEKLRWLIRFEPGTNGDSGKTKTRTLNFAHYEMALAMLAEWHLEGVARDEENMPLPVVHWLIECVEEWLDTQLSFRVRDGCNVAQSEE